MGSVVPRWLRRGRGQQGDHGGDTGDLGRQGGLAPVVEPDTEGGRPGARWADARDGAQRGGRAALEEERDLAVRVQQVGAGAVVENGEKGVLARIVRRAD